MKIFLCDYAHTNLVALMKHFDYEGKVSLAQLTQIDHGPSDTKLSDQLSILVRLVLEGIEDACAALSVNMDNDKVQEFGERLLKI